MLTSYLNSRSRLGRLIALALMPTLFLNASVLQAMADDVNTPSSPKAPAAVTTAKPVKANRKLPKFTPASSKFSLSNQPSDQEIFSHSLFAEPLVPIGGKTTAAENAALGQALTKFSERKVRDNYSALEGFLASHPTSPWRLSLLVNLGWLQRQTGWYSKSMDTWTTAWTEGQRMRDPQAKPIVDRALAELIVLNARVGRMDQLKKLIPQADGRGLTGSSKEKVEAAKQALVLMQTKPETSFRCGPMALEKIRNLMDHNDPSKLKVMSMESTQQGTSMLQLKKLSHKLGLDYQVAKRTPGSAVVTPAVINWKLGHYAALLKKEGKDGLWHLHDPTFGKDVWVSTAAIDAEASGYFLVPSGDLPAGWQPVDDKVAATVWGKGQNNGANGNNNKSGPKCGCPTSTSTHSMARPSIYESTTSLSVDDTPLFYQPAYGPEVDFTVSYSQRELNQPSTYDYANLGPLWTCSWLAYITDDPDFPGIDVTEYQSGGGTLTFIGYNSDTESYAPEPQTSGVLKITGSSSYELDMPDGSKQIFGLANSKFPRQVFMTQSVDPQGNALTYSYDYNFRLVAVTDATGQVTTLAYQSTNPNDPGYYRIATVTDPFGRTATLAYDSAGNLISSTDMIGIASQYNYYGGALNSLTTPYGTTTFDVGQDSDKRWVQINDPGGGQQRLETWNNYNYNVPASVSQYPAGADNSFLNLRNSFFWDREAMMACAGTLDYTKAQITHWLHEPDYSTMSDIPESTKNALEDRVYYTYLNQPANIVTGDNAAPTSVRRILSNGHTQTTTIVNNAMGLPTRVTDPLGRVTNYSYASNNIDVTQTSQVNGSNNDVLWSATYNSQHEPLTTTDASGQITTYTYNTNGQTTSITDPKSEEIIYSYNLSGLLTTLTDQATGATLSFTYDGAGRIQTSVDEDGYTLTYSYDNLNRKTQVVLPDGSYDQYSYTNLDMTVHRDREGRITRYIYNPLEQVVGINDSNGGTTTYERCACGSLLAEVDSLGRRTKWSYDLEGKPLTKVLPDGSQIQYTYDTNYSGNLTTSLDQKEQTATIDYNDDESVNQITYPDSVTSFVYDSFYPRLTGVTKTVGATNSATLFTYWPAYVSGSPIMGAGRVKTETGPLGSTSAITYNYDELGRVVDVSINGTSDSVSYDSTGRMLTSSNPLGTFTYDYDGSTQKPLSISNDQNGLNTHYGYQTSSGEYPLLANLTNNLTGTTVLSKFGYTYDLVGNIKTWTQQIDSNAPTVWTFGYDSLDQLVSGIQTNSSTGDILSNRDYKYDLAGNRTSAQSGLNVFSAAFNSLNQITSGGAGGQLQFTGSLSKPGTVNIGGQPAAMDSSYLNFSGSAEVVEGTNTVPVVATSVNGFAATNNYQVVIPPKSGISPSYDANGNLTSNGRGQTYSWNAENQLIGITYSDGSSTNLTYDGLGRWLAIVEKDSGGSTTATKQFVWVGSTLAEERDATNAVVKRFYPQGEEINGANYYFACDQLGNIREMLDNGGTIEARYDYDPYGNVTKVSGSMDADFTYTGSYYHRVSGLNLMQYRAYDPKSGRWLSPDPLGDTVGSNLYSYSLDNPVNGMDPLGLITIIIPGMGPQQDNGGNSSNEDFIRGVKRIDPQAVVVPRDDKDDAISDIMHARASGDDTVNIYGYSRGGVAAYELAQMLNKAHIPVDNLNTVDPVIVKGLGDDIPNPIPVPCNVKQANNYYHKGPSTGPTDYPGTPIVDGPNAHNHVITQASTRFRVIHANMPIIVLGP